MKKLRHPKPKHLPYCCSLWLAIRLLNIKMIITSSEFPAAVWASTIDASMQMRRRHSWPAMLQRWPRFSGASCLPQPYAQALNTFVSSARSLSWRAVGRWMRRKGAAPSLDVVTKKILSRLASHCSPRSWSLAFWHFWIHTRLCGALRRARIGGAMVRFHSLVLVHRGLKM